MIKTSFERNLVAAKFLRSLGFEKPRVLKALIDLNAITTGHLADMLDVSQQNISMHISGSRRKTKIQEDIAAALGVPLDVIFDTRKGDYGDDSDKICSV